MTEIKLTVSGTTLANTVTLTDATAGCIDIAHTSHVGTGTALTTTIEGSPNIISFKSASGKYRDISLADITQNMTYTSIAGTVLATANLNETWTNKNIGATNTVGRAHYVRATNVVSVGSPESATVAGNALMTNGTDATAIWRPMPQNSNWQSYAVRFTTTSTSATTVVTGILPPTTIAKLQSIWVVVYASTSTGGVVDVYDLDGATILGSYAFTNTTPTLYTMNGVSMQSATLNLNVAFRLRAQSAGPTVYLLSVGFLYF
jgi:hypothetical protein